jgi:hypothetical protein
VQRSETHHCSIFVVHSALLHAPYEILTNDFGLL